MAFNLPSGPLDMRKTTKGKGRTFRKTEEGAGMTKKGVKQYRAENPWLFPMVRAPFCKHPGSS